MPSARNTDVAKLTADVIRIFGRPPFLQTENPTDYDNLLAEVASAVLPTDFILKMLARDIANEVWREMRYDRNIALCLDQKIRQHLSFSAVARGTADGRTSDAPSVADGETLPEPSAPQSDAGALAEQAQAYAFEQSMGFLKDCEYLKGLSYNRRNFAVEMVSRHRESLTLVPPTEEIAIEPPAVGPVENDPPNDEAVAAISASDIVPSVVPALPQPQQEPTEASHADGAPDRG